MAIELSRELLVAAKRGDTRAYNRVAIWMTDALLDFFEVRGHELPDACDLSQRTMEDIVKKFAKAPEDPELFRSFVERFAEIVRKRKRSEEQSEDNKRAAALVLPRTPARRPDSLLAVRRLFAQAKAWLRGLSPLHRDTLVRTLERDNHREVARDLDVPLGTVRRRVWEARSTLRSDQRRSRQTGKRFRT